MIWLALWLYVVGTVIVFALVDMLPFTRRTSWGFVLRLCSWPVVVPLLVAARLLSGRR